MPALEPGLRPAWAAGGGVADVEGPPDEEVLVDDAVGLVGVAAAAATAPGTVKMMG